MYSGYSNRRGNHGRINKRNRMSESGGESSQGFSQSGRHPGHLRGKAIGMFYHKRSLEKKKTMPMINLPEDRLMRIEVLLDSLPTADDQGKEDFTADPIFNHKPQGKFEKEYFDIITVSYQEKLKNAIKDKSETLTETDKEISIQLRNEQLEKLSNPKYKNMLEFRKKLPTYKMRDEILKTIKENQVVVISGDTGCGKTTQVGQLLLEEACLTGNGAKAQILITQPRRIAATSVARRIADERAEKLGHSVGYSIRLECIPPRRLGSVEVVTAGVVLQRLQGDPGLLSISHLLLDEVHERDTTCDLLMGLLKQILPKRKDLKLILMSATLEAERLCQYFWGCPLVTIPGLMFPVTEYYLEDALELTGFTNFQKKYVGNDRRRHGFLKRYLIKQQKQAKDKEFKDVMTPYIANLRKKSKYSESVIELLWNPEIEELNCDLIASLVKKLSQGPPGAILVFMPGLADISKVIDCLQRGAQLPPHILLPLHSRLNTLDQHAIFNPPPEGTRKIIISTNIAETSITIDDVVYVIDCGRMKITNYDLEDNVSTLTAEWVSQANAHQRKGRAGRVQEGQCWRLFTRSRMDRLMSRPAPEITRAPLHEPLLTALLLRLYPAADFLITLLDPPHSMALNNATTLLTRMGILDYQGRLTPLGVHVARLPVSPGSARMLLLAGLFSAAAPATAVAAVTAFKDPFVVPFGKEKDVDQCRREMSRGSGSDQLTAAEAQRQFERLSGSEVRQFCYENFLSEKSLLLLRDMRSQFGQLLHQAKFLSSPSPDHPANNRHSNNRSLLKALIVAGLYPNVAAYKGKFGLTTEVDRRVEFHPGSVNCRGPRPAPRVVFGEKVKSTSLFLHNTSPAHTLPLLFFGDNFNIEERPEGIGEPNDVMVTGGQGKWLASRRLAILLKRLRDALQALLKAKLQDPAPVDWNKPEGKVLKAIIELITVEDDPDQMIDSD